MIISEQIKKNLLDLKQIIEYPLANNGMTDLQIENFLKRLEQIRYNLLAEIKLYNKNYEFEDEKIKTIDNEYKAELIDNVLKIYVPEVMPSYKNIKTHTHKRILLNIAEITKKFEGQFKNAVFIYIKIFDKIIGWDVDNRYVKPIADGLILSKVIQDDNISKMSYCVKGEFSEKPHTEIYVFDSDKINNFLENIVSKNVHI